MGRSGRSRGHAWEVLLMDLGRVEGMELWGTLVVADADVGRILHVTPVGVGEELSAHLLRVEGKRARVLRVLPDQQEMFRAAGEALGCPVHACPELPLAEAFAAHVAEQLGAGSAPLQVDDAPAWRAVGAALQKASPWSAIEDDILFELDGGPATIRGWVGVVLGAAGAQRGLAFYRSAKDHHAFRSVFGGAGGALPDGFCAVLITLDALADMPPSHRAHDLCVGEDMVAPARFAEDALTSLPADEGPAWRAACEAVVGAWRQHGEAIRFMPTTSHVTTSQGTVTVRTRDADPELLAGLEVQIEVEVSDGLVLASKLRIRATKGDAHAARALLLGVDGYDVEVSGDYLVVRAWRGDVPAGILRVLPSHPTLLGGLQGPLDLEIAQGGTRSREVRPRDVIHAVNLSRRP